MAEQHWLDTLGKGLASGLSRKEFLKLVGSVALAVLGNTAGEAEAAEMERTKPCSDGKTRCGKKCVDTDKSRKHCGGCGQKCRKSQTCVEGRCLDRDGGVSCGGVRCPDTSFTCKGDACVCPDDREPCVSPHQPPRRAGVHATCCLPDQICVDGRCSACLSGASPCGDICCGPGNTCADGRCRCDLLTCPSGQICCPPRFPRMSPNCCPAGTSCCAGKCCGSGEKCFEGGDYSHTFCCPTGSTGCGLGVTGSPLCCSPNKTCCYQLGGNGNNSVCCNPGEPCLQTAAGPRCGSCPDERDPCVHPIGGSLVCCGAGQTCIKGYCSPPREPLSDGPQASTTRT